MRQISNCVQMAIREEKEVKTRAKLFRIIFIVLAQLWQARFIWQAHRKGRSLVYRDNRDGFLCL